MYPLFCTQLPEPGARDGKNGRSLITRPATLKIAPLVSNRTDVSRPAVGWTKTCQGWCIVPNEMLILGEAGGTNTHRRTIFEEQGCYGKTKSL